MRLRLFLLLLSSIAIAESHDSGSTGLFERAMVGGQASSIDQVLEIRSGSGQPCTATVVGARELITTAGCVPDGDLLQVNLNAARGGTAKWVAVECKRHPDYRSEPYAKEMHEKGKALLADCQKALKARDASLTKQVEAAAQAFARKVREAYVKLSEDPKKKNDLAVCRIGGGGFTAAPAKIAPIDTGSPRLLLAGFGSVKFKTDLSKAVLKQNSASLKVTVGKTGILSGKSNRGDGAAAWAGDMGGPLYVKSGNGITIGAIASGSSAAFQQLDVKTCTADYRPEKEATTWFTDLTSPEARKFLSGELGKP